MNEARLAAIAAAVIAGEYDVSLHAIEQLIDRQLDLTHIRSGLCDDDPEVIEDEPGHHYGPCCLVLCWISGRPLHIKLSYPPRPTIITAYRPDLRAQEWDDRYRRRIKQNDD